MKVLFIGGTGTISSACLKPALEKNFELFIFNRGERKIEVPKGTVHIKGDIRNKTEAVKILKNYKFDAVVNWIAFTTEHIQTDMEIFRDKISQYIFISSASVYQKPPSHYIVTESTPLYNPFWEYSRNKIACEELLIRNYRESGFPVTIVRPSYTYCRWAIPTIMSFDYTIIERLKKNKEIFVHGDGQSLWTMTFNEDFAKGFTGLLCNPKAMGEAFHITSDEVLTWDQIYQTIGREIGVKPKIIHIPSDFISSINPDVGSSLLGDKAYSVVFDNSKIKRTVPGFCANISFAEGVRRCLEWFEKHPENKTANKNSEERTDEIISKWKLAMKNS